MEAIAPPEKSRVFWYHQNQAVTDGDDRRYPIDSNYATETMETTSASFLEKQEGYEIAQTANKEADVILRPFAIPARSCYPEGVLATEGSPVHQADSSVARAPSE